MSGQLRQPDLERRQDPLSLCGVIQVLLYDMTILIFQSMYNFPLMALDRLVNLTVDILQNSIKRLEQGRDDRLLEKGFALFSQRIPVHLKPSLHIVALDIDILQQFISRVFQVRHKQAF
ncbi:hypothetical protein, partial [uncultured Oscillibacter sp.]|uniref:hypothetical protein n=1 Tax=uncultured Oscillibacter sp. TaxID=876091 RepID=UPI00272B64FA